MQGKDKIRPGHPRHHACAVTGFEEDILAETINKSINKTIFAAQGVARCLSVEFGCPKVRYV